MPDEAQETSVSSVSAIAVGQEAIGRTEIRREILSPEPLQRFALSVGAHPAVVDHAPPLGHWAFFLPATEDSAIDLDGHAKRGDFLPAIPLARRMFAGSTIEFSGPLLLGREAQLTSRVTAVSYKRGRSGELAFVEIDRTIQQEGSIRVSEQQQFVYRELGPTIEMPVGTAPLPKGETWQPNEANLFRFSAATFNSHRIHYDLPYARSVEGYPALVVHGPFTATKLAGLAQREGNLARFSFRAMAPLFLGQPIALRTTGKGAVEAVRCDGVVAMRAKFVTA